MREIDPINPLSDKSMVDAVIRPPKLEKDPEYHFKSQTEKEVLKEMKKDYKRGNKALKEAMLAAIVDNSKHCKINISKFSVI